jgi:Protein of unknown function (DUF1631)
MTDGGWRYSNKVSQKLAQRPGFGENGLTMKKFLLRRLGVAHDAGSVKPTLQACLETVLEQSDALIDEVLTGLEVSVVSVAGKSLHGQISKVGQDAVAALSAQRELVRKTFANTLRSAVYGGNKPGESDAAKVRFDDFQFLEEDQIDANIELALTQQEVMRTVDDVMPPLNGYISSLMGWSTVQPYLNPLKPESFVFALRETLTQHVPKEDARAALMTPAAGLLGVGMRQLYREVSDWLRTQGVEAAGPVAVSGGFGAVTKPAENSVTRTLLTLDKLRRLLSGELEMGPQAGKVGDFTHTVPASYAALEDLKLVEPMMKRLAARADQNAAQGIKPAPIARGPKSVHREHAQSKYLGRQLGEEVVRLMLESLMQNHRLLAPVRQSLQSMEPLLIKLSQSDARFFSERQHPARQFLDKITHRSLGFTSPDAPDFPAFVAAFNQAIATLAAGEGDAAAFATVLHGLEERWTHDEQEQRQNAEEAARSLLHAEQRNLLAQRFSADFSARLENKTIPDMVATFLRGPWAQVVAEAQLRCVDGTEDADGYLGLVGDLIWSVRPRLARRNRARLVQMVPGMLVKMRQGLELISYPQERMLVFFDELITFHEQAFDSPRPVSATDEVPTGASQEAALRSVALPPDEVWMAEEEAADSGYLDATHSIPPHVEESPEVPDATAEHWWSTDSLTTGSWVDLALGGQWVRAELTWVSPHRTLFMFISNGGLAHSMSRRTMDRLRGMGLIRLVSDGKVMDSALDAVAQAALRNNRGRPDPAEG